MLESGEMLMGCVLVVVDGIYLVLVIVCGVDW